MVHVYTGDGKGKSTCAAGLAARCAGRGQKVAFFQFLKCEPSGECVSLADQISFYRLEEPFGFVFQMSDTEKETVKQNTRMLWDKACSMQCDMLVLDELFGAISVGFVLEEELLSFLDNTSAEVVITGRDAPLKVLEKADYVTEMKCIKHPYDKGVSARCGIEF